MEAKPFNKNVLTEWIFKSLFWMHDTNVAYSPYTWVTKAMVEAGVKQAIFLCSLDMEDDPADGPKPPQLQPIYVDLVVSEENLMSGNIQAFGYSVVLKDLNLSEVELNNFEEFKKSVTVSEAISVSGFHIPN